MNNEGSAVEGATEGPGGAANVDQAFISVIIPHYNDLEALSVCIAGLHAQTWPADRLEIIVADNNSACGIEAVVRAAPGCRVVPAPVQGAGPARNCGAAVARGEVLAFIDSDCNPRPDWAENGAHALAAYDFVGGRVETVAKDPARPTAVEAWEIVFGFDFERYILIEGYTGSGNMWVWRTVFDSVGGFRTGVAEDMDWSFRARAAGFRLGYEPSAVVSHLARPSWSDLKTRWRRVLAEHHALTLEKPFGLMRWAAKTAAMPLSAAPHLLKVLRSDRLPDGRAKAGAAAVLVAHRLWRTGVMARLLFTAPARDGIRSTSA
ncbi:glycosyltransferase [Methylocapsa palsarum]|uniref:Glycosyl transferase family 2 n=1 Tax=Methylocapsa palsarum TaxID=1612308 RepID=A0A1I4CA82_9HYPH|nr:glycosyltransferase [Methylocapsa palsarum]SFK77179.1 Glycosyl transferase family 2 [Methylocapsa palsarum]